MAASLVLVVGLAWQLRPNLPPMEAHEVASDVAPMAEAPPLPAAMPLPAPPLVAETASAPANPAARMANPAQPNRGAAPPASRTSVPATDMPAEPATHTASPPQQITVTGSRVAKAAAANAGQQRAREVAPPAPPAPPAPAMAAPPPPPQTAIVLPAPASAERAQLAAAPAAFIGDIAPPGHQSRHRPARAAMAATHPATAQGGRRRRRTRQPATLHRNPPENPHPARPAALAERVSRAPATPTACIHIRRARLEWAQCPTP